MMVMMVMMYFGTFSILYPSGIENCHVTHAENGCLQKPSTTSPEREGGEGSAGKTHTRQPCLRVHTNTTVQAAENLHGWKHFIGPMCTCKAKKQRTVGTCRRTLQYTQCLQKKWYARIYFIGRMCTYRQNKERLAPAYEHSVCAGKGYAPTHFLRNKERLAPLHVQTVRRRYARKYFVGSMCTCKTKKGWHQYTKGWNLRLNRNGSEPLCVGHGS